MKEATRNCEIARNGQNAFVVNEWNELAERLNSLFDVEPETYLQMAHNSRRIYEENFTFEKFKTNYLILLSGLA